ncbi:hypothetical protein LAZ67_2004082, partial [Cordylochernes scorpioides]
MEAEVKLSSSNLEIMRNKMRQRLKEADGIINNMEESVMEVRENEKKVDALRRTMEHKMNEAKSMVKKLKAEMRITNNRMKRIKEMVETPEPFNFSNPGDWPKWIRRFERFRQASGLINNPENEQVNMLVYCMGDNADDILLSCKIASDQLENYNKVIECFESHFIPRRNIIYERARFNQRCQQEGEKVNEFITALHSLAEHCNFGMLHGELIRDRIVVGVRDRALSERMQLDTDLTLVKATLMAKQLESVKEQQSSLYQQDSVDQIKKMPNHIEETKRHEPKIRQFKSNQLGGSSHGCTRQINFKIDTGADVNVLPLQNYYQSFQRIKLEKSDKILQGPNGIPLETVGMIHVKLQNKGQHLNSKIYIVDKLKQPLLSGETSEKLNIVRMIQQLSSGGRGGQRGRLGSGDNRGCYNCGEEDHRKFECTKPARGGGRGRGQSRDGGSNNTCYNCGEVGHRKYECTNNTAEDGGQEENQRKSKKACYICGEFGHKKDDCPKSGTQDSGDEEESSDNEEEEVEAEEPPKKKSKKPKSKKKEEDCYLTLQAYRTMPLESARSREMRRSPLRHQPGSQGDARMTRSKRPRRIALHQRPHLQEMEGCRGTTKTRIQRRASLQCQPCIQDMEGQSRYLEASGVSTKKDDVKRATLLHCLGLQVQRIFFNLPEEKDTYEKAKEALTKYFTPQKNIVSERFKFRQRKQNTDENIDSYVIALRELVKSCKFGNLEEDMIRDQIIEKCYNRQLKEKLLQQDNLNLQRTIEISRMFETAKEEFRVLTNEDMTSINRVNYKNNFQAANESTVKGPKAHNVYHQKGSTSKVSAPNLEECYRCGLTTHPPYKCGARNMKCTFCNKMGHLNRVCRNKNKYKNIEGKKRNIQNISENNEDSDEYTFFLGSDNKENIYIDGKEITMTIDTGSDTTFIGLENLKNIFPKSQMPTLNGSERKFYAYGQTSPLPCCGYFFADVSWGERSIKEQIFVIEGKAEPLLGKKASFELEIIKRGTKIRNIQQEVIPKDIYNLIQENMNLFQGQGNVKGYSQKITLKENVTPVAQRCRHFPYKMVEAINQELDKMIEDGIFEEVHEASEWISNIVAVPKKGTEEIRLCVDLKEVMEHNQAYKERMKKYADSKNKALPHDFKKGNIVYVANTEMKSKLTPNYDNQRFIILETISPNSFKLVNTETGSFIIRNAKHLRHANVLQDFNKGIDLNTTLIKTPEIRMELPSTSRYLPEQEATLEDIVPEEQIAISDMDCLYPNESPNENENKTVITRSGRQIH